MDNEDNDSKRRDRRERKREALSRSLLWRICHDGRAKQCRRQRRCIGNRDLCYERLFPSGVDYELRWHLRNALLLSSLEPLSPVELAEEVADEMEASGREIPPDQVKKVAAILSHYFADSAR